MSTQADEPRISKELMQLGYFSTKPTNGDSNGDQLSEAVRGFQTAYAGAYSLNATGELNSLTRKILLQPKCGCADRESSGPMRRPARPSEETSSGANGDAVTPAPLRYAFETVTRDSDAQRARQQVRLAFATWESLGRVSFLEVEIGQDPDIVVSWVAATGILVGDAIARADFPNTGTRPQRLEFDDSEHLWIIGEALNGFDIQTVALHEIGHLLGLDHVADPDSVMHFSFLANRTKRGLRAPDLEAFTKLFSS